MFIPIWHAISPHLWTGFDSVNEGQLRYVSGRCLRSQRPLKVGCWLRGRRGRCEGFLSEDHQINVDPRIQPYIEQMEWIFFNSWVILFGTVFFFKMFSIFLFHWFVGSREWNLSEIQMGRRTPRVGVWSHFGCNLWIMINGRVLSTHQNRD